MNTEARRTLAKRWIALALAVVFVPFAFLYLQNYRRALGYIVALFAPFVSGLVALTWGWPGLATLALCASFVIALAGIRDAWHRAGAAAARPTPAPTYAIIAIGCAALLLIGATRAFIGEPFKIPSSSMAPLLQRGDLVVVSKWGYGNYGSDKLPVRGARFRAPQRGDIVVFKWPSDTKIDYVKRVIGLPGDVVEYRAKRLSVNNRPAQYEALGKQRLAATFANYLQLSEAFADERHLILNDPNAPPVVMHSVKTVALKHCSYDAGGFRCGVPAGHYFMLGDNRDSSNDSRYWGMVPQENLLGRVVWSTRLFRRRE